MGQTDTQHCFSIPRTWGALPGLSRLRASIVDLFFENRSCPGFVPPPGPRVGQEYASDSEGLRRFVPLSHQIREFPILDLRSLLFSISKIYFSTSPIWVKGWDSGTERHNPSESHRYFCPGFSKRVGQTRDSRDKTGPRRSLLPRFVPALPTQTYTALP